MRSMDLAAGCRNIRPGTSMMPAVPELWTGLRLMPGDEPEEDRKHYHPTGYGLMASRAQGAPSHDLGVTVP